MKIYSQPFKINISNLYWNHHYPFKLYRFYLFYKIEEMHSKTIIFITIEQCYLFRKFFSNSFYSNIRGRFHIFGTNLINNNNNNKKYLSSIYYLLNKKYLLLLLNSSFFQNVSCKLTVD